jgi:lysosomal alpha-mannosidase
LELIITLIIKFRKELVIGNQVLPKVSYCQLNVSQCDPTEKNNRFVVNIYNSMARSVDKYVRVPVASKTAFQVLDPQGIHKFKLYMVYVFRNTVCKAFFPFAIYVNVISKCFVDIGNVVASQTVPIAEYVKSLPGRVSSATVELVFLASQLPPLGSKSYYVQPGTSKDEHEPQNKFAISNEV